ncbi:unnamed protein product, partial [Protopolystoma xenopodis]
MSKLIDDAGEMSGNVPRPRFDDVHHMMDESSAHFHPKRGRKFRGLRQHEYPIQFNRLQYNEFHPSSSDKISHFISQVWSSNSGLIQSVLKLFSEVADCCLLYLSSATAQSSLRQTKTFSGSLYNCLSIWSQHLCSLAQLTPNARFLGLVDLLSRGYAKQNIVYFGTIISTIIVIFVFLSMYMFVPYDYTTANVPISKYNIATKINLSRFHQHHSPILQLKDLM